MFPPDQTLLRLEKKQWKEKMMMIVIFLLFGIAEFIVSILLMLESEGYYLGGIYLGGLAIIVSFMGLLIESNGYWLCNSILMTVTSVASAALQGFAWNDVYYLEACAIYSQKAQTSCTSFPNNYDCFGNSDYFDLAQFCAVDYKSGNDQNACNCVHRSDKNNCLVFEDTDRCDQLINTIPTLLLVSFIFAILLGWASVIITYRMDHLYRKRRDYRPPKPAIEQNVEFVLETPLSAKAFSKPY